MRQTVNIRKLIQLLTSSSRQMSVLSHSVLVIWWQETFINKFCWGQPMCPLITGATEGTEAGNRLDIWCRICLTFTPVYCLLTTCNPVGKKKKTPLSGFNRLKNKMLKSLAQRIDMLITSLCLRQPNIINNNCKFYSLARRALILLLFSCW